MSRWDRLSFAVETFTVEFDDPRIVEIGRKVLCGGGADPALMTNLSLEPINTRRAEWRLAQESACQRKRVRLRKKNKVVLECGKACRVRG